LAFKTEESGSKKILNPKEKKNNNKAHFAHQKECSNLSTKTFLLA
jgi:hypothetical protein